MEILSKLENRIISKEASILEALKKMDDESVKLLLILDNKGFFSGLLSVGDLQRAIINNFDVKTEIKNILRKDIVIGYEEDSFLEIKNKLYKCRAEFMPVINKNKEIIDIFFWDEVFKEREIYRTISDDIQVIVMAGGVGSRLKPITNIIPKALIPFDDSTIIERIMYNFKKNGLRKFLFSVNYKGNMIIDHLEALNNNFFDLKFYKEKFPMGTIGSLSLMKKNIKGTFFVTNCDVLIEQDYYEIFDFHRKEKNDVTLVTSIKQISIPYGTIQMNKEGIFQDIKEKPKFTYMVNTGMYVMEKNILDIISDRKLDMTTLITKLKNKGYKIGCFPVSEKSWIDIGQWDKYKHILNNLIVRK